VTVSGGLLRLQTPGNGEIVDITDGVARVVGVSGADRGLVTAFAVGSPGCGDDDGVRARAASATCRSSWADWSPPPVAHNRPNRDSDSHAHQRASLIGPSETIPVVDGRPMLGTWQQIVLIDFDDRPRERTLSVQVVS
jgi:thiamine phosphate synthase YjbQ (UPF0047 family)